MSIVSARIFALFSTDRLDDMLWNLTPALPHDRSRLVALPDIENLASTLSETPKGESHMASRREAANHEAQIQEQACPAENKARPSRLGACQDRRDRKFEVVRIATQLSAFDR
jgi:hypothetical protein